MSSLQVSRADGFGGAAWMALGLALMAGAWRMDRFEQMGGTLYTAPGLVPGLYGLLMLVLGAALAWRSRQAPPAAAATPTPPPLLNRRVLLMLVLTLAYAAVAVGRLPFVPATAVFVALFCALYDERKAGWRRWCGAALAGVLTALVVMLVFERVFLVRLP